MPNVFLILQFHTCPYKAPEFFLFFLEVMFSLCFFPDLPVGEMKRAQKIKKYICL